MLISNPPTIATNSLQNPSEAALFLRVNQHIAGEVIKVDNEQVVLSIQGVQVVARMSTPEQAAILVERRFAQFIIKDMSGELLTLQLVDPRSSITPQAAITSDTRLLSKLMIQLGIPNSGENEIIAQAAIRTGLTITPALIKELQSALSNIPKWGLQQAEAATLLKSFGLPVTTGAIELLLHARPEIGGQLRDLTQQLAQVMVNDRLPIHLKEQVQHSFQILNQAVIDASLPTNDLAGKIQNTIILLGKSIENELWNIPKSINNHNDASSLERGLMVLARLRNDLASQGLVKIAGAIDQFNDSIRLMHLYHASTLESPSANQWIRLEIPVNFPALIQPTIQEQNEMPTATIRIARDPDSDGLSVNPGYTRLVIRMDINEKDVVEVDLSVVDHNAGLSISTSSPLLTSIAQTELPELCEALLRSGYDTRISQVDTKQDLVENTGQNMERLDTFIAGVNLEA